MPIGMTAAVNVPPIDASIRSTIVNVLREHSHVETETAD